MFSAALILLLAAAPAAEAWNMSACFVPQANGGISALAYIGDRACVPLGPATEMDGVWLNAFEGSKFIANKSDIGDRPAGIPAVWLTVDEKTVWPSGSNSATRNRAYRIKFVGRYAKDMNRRPSEGYGHLSMSPGLVMVDRVLEIVDIGPTAN